MTNELIKTLIGKVCYIATGSFGTSFQQAKIIEVVENWIKIETKGQIDLVNADYVTNIKVLPEKYQW